MTWGWQDVATLAIVASALVYLARKFVPGLSPGSGRGVRALPVEEGHGAGSCRDQPVVITLTGAVGARKGRAFGPRESSCTESPSSAGEIMLPRRRSEARLRLPHGTAPRAR